MTAPQGEQPRESFLSFYGKVPREVKGKLVWASRLEGMQLPDWCLMVLEEEANRMIEEESPDWDDSRGNR